MLSDLGHVLFTQYIHKSIIPLLGVYDCGPGPILRSIRNNRTNDDCKNPAPWIRLPTSTTPGTPGTVSNRNPADAILVLKDGDLNRNRSEISACNRFVACTCEGCRSDNHRNKSSTSIVAAHRNAMYRADPDFLSTNPIDAYQNSRIAMTHQSSQAQPAYRLYVGAQFEVHHDPRTEPRSIHWIRADIPIRSLAQPIGSCPPLPSIRMHGREYR